MLNNKNIVIAYFFCLIIFGLPINLYWNRSYDAGNTVGEWLISYAGGFVRRGLPGSLFYQLSTALDFPVVYLIWVWSILVYMALALVLRDLCYPLVNLQFLLSPLLLLAPVIGNFVIRKDVYLVLCYGACLLVVKFYVASKLNSIAAFLLINAIAVPAILSHEQFGIWALPSLVLFIAFVFIILGGLRVFRAFLLSAGFFFPCIVSMVAILLHKGNRAQASAIHLAWTAIPNLLPASGRSVEPSGSIDSIGWSIGQGWHSSGVSVFQDFDGWVWVPLAWVLTVFVCFSIFVYLPSKDEVGLRKSICFFQLLCFLPMFIIGLDFGRWIFNWMALSVLSYGLISNLRDFFVFRYSPTLHLDRLIRGFHGLASRLPAVPLTESAWLAVLMLISIPRCCWTFRNYLIVSPPYYGLFLLKRYLVALYHWGHLPQSFSYPIL